MNSEIPKQFMLLKGLPVLMHTIHVFRSYDPGLRMIVVLPVHFVDEWKALCIKHSFRETHEIRTGGVNRFESVKRGLKGLPDESLVAVHDGVRPLVSIKTIERCFEVASRMGNAVPCTFIPETLRKIKNNGNQWVDREQYRLIQTPQVFQTALLKDAYKITYHKGITDDAGAVESLGHPIHLVDGNPENIKITCPHDLIIAGALMDSGSGTLP